MHHYNLPPGVTPRMIDGPPDTRTSDERAREWFCDNRGVPPDDYTYEYVRNRMIRDDEPGPDEVLRWIEEQVVEGGLDPVDQHPDTSCALCGGLGYYYNEFRNRRVCGCRAEFAYEPRDRHIDTYPL